MGNMWSVARFKEHLEEVMASGNHWEEKIVPQMKDIVRHTTMAAQGDMRARKNSFALYGYDFMIDEGLGVWLLEVNASPTMEPSTDITLRMCREVQEDIVKVQLSGTATLVFR